MSANLDRAWASLATDPRQAERKASAALKAAPGRPEAIALLAGARRRLGDVAGSAALLRPLMARRPALDVAWFEWGMTLSAMGEESEAVRALHEAARLQPRSAAAWRALGDQLVMLGAGADAGQAYARALWAATRAPRLVEAATALAEGRAAAAEVLLLPLVRQDATDARANHLLAEAAMRVGRVAEAQAVLLRCLELDPRFAEARHSLAILLYVQRQFGPAIPHLRTLLKAVPDQPSLAAMLAHALLEIGAADEALPLHEAMLAAFRAQPRVWLAYGHTLQTLGRVAEAAAAYRACIALAPGWSAGAYLSLADLKTVPFTPGEVTAMQADLLRPGIETTRAAQLHYALGLAHEQGARYEQAFGHFAEGAALQRRAVSYDAAATTAFVAASKEVYAAGFFARRRGSGCASAEPIFIVGLPRSGSTLVEQILASHPDIEATTELKVLGEIAAGLRGARPAADLPRLAGALDAAALARLGGGYLEATRQFRRLGRRFFTDKMPDNFLHAGLIHLILPNARIIDVRRAPMAVGFAAFKQFFQTQQTGQAYTYDLAEIGRYYRDYVDLMAHFDTALPGRIHRIDYELLVTSTEQEVRRLLDYCGVGFDPACLRFWETARTVQTPSAQQVRRPISRDGLEHWRHYERWLGPLRKALDEG